MLEEYDKLKFKAGLEIHQQLDTRKLFCNCPSVLRRDEPDFEIKRKLHAVAGESGEIDLAVQHEAKSNKEFIYQGYDTTCLVELDEEPPHEINSEALKIAIQIALLLNMKIVPITQIMRKTVINGSNTSGFQRTVMIAEKGFVETESGGFGIKSLFLEEDAARIVEKSENKIIYKLDRLGIPLVEIVTEPEIKNPEQAKEVALKIGEILRSCNVRRGIGTIRQDVNVSIRGENRVELKGMQDMNLFIKVIEGEVERQKELSDSKKPTKMEVRNALPEGSTEFMRPLSDSSRMYPETDLPLLRISRDIINNAKKTLPKLKADVETELKKGGLNKEMIKILLKQNKLEKFKELNLIVNEPKLIAKLLLIYPKEIASHKKIKMNKIEEMLDNDVLAFVLEALNKKKISEAQIKNVLEKVVDGIEFTEAIKFGKIGIKDIEEFIVKLIKEKSGLSEKAYMGLVMKEFRGKIDGRTAMELIKKFGKS